MFEGVGVALVTLFDERGELDPPPPGPRRPPGRPRVKAVIVAGTTGEAATLDADERSDVLLAVRHAVRDRVPVIAGGGAPGAPGPPVRP